MKININRVSDVFVFFKQKCGLVKWHVATQRWSIRAVFGVEHPELTRGCLISIFGWPRDQSQKKYKFSASKNSPGWFVPAVSKKMTSGVFSSVVFLIPLIPDSNSFIPLGLVVVALSANLTPTNPLFLEVSCIRRLRNQVLPNFGNLSTIIWLTDQDTYQT